jgi:hypothetical protein
MQARFLHGMAALASLVALSLLGMNAVIAANSVARVRAFARLPDWSGYWAWNSGVAVDPLSGEPDPALLVQVFANTKLAAHPPYNNVWEARYQAAVQAGDALRASGKVDATSKGCTFGFPAQMEAFEETIQAVTLPEETILLFERGEQRHIYTDGRQHPGKDDLWPTNEGDSIGRWEGETLVVDTIARKAGPIGFFAPHASLSDQAHFVERIRRVNPNVLEDQMTIEDPVAFLRAWQVTIRYSRVKGLDRFIGYDCENDRNPIVDGHLTIAPP